MIHRFQFSQEDLEVICEQPRWHPFEYSPVNRYYGHGDIIRRYAGLPLGVPLCFSVEHYVPLDPEKVHEFDFTPGLPAFFAVNQERANVYRRLGKPRPIPAGATIHYAKEVLEGSGQWTAPQESERRGTLAFPHKSTRKRDRSFDFEAFADMLLRLPSEFQPVYVCLFWKDYEKGRDEPYRKRGIPVVSAGHINDGQFLFRLIDLCSRFRYACGNAPGSCYPLSVTCGCHFFMAMGGPVLEKEAGYPDQEVEVPGSDTQNGRRLREAAPFPPTESSRRSQVQLVEELTGKRFLLSPEKIQELNRQSREWLLDHQPAVVAFESGNQLAALNAWLGIGIDSDGWARSSGEITPGPHAAGRLLRIRIELPPWLREENTFLELEMQGAKAIKASLEPGYFEIGIPIPSCPSGKALRFRATQDSRLSPDDDRRVAFRFLEWEVVEGNDEGSWQFQRIEVPGGDSSQNVANP